MSTLLVSSMLFQDLLYAAPDLKPLSFGAQAITLDASVGTVQETFHAPSASKTLYLLQDAHTNESAQRSIASILGTLGEKKKIRYVFLEAGTGDDSLSALRALADAPRRKRVADIHLRRAHIQGPDYLDLTSELDLQLWGVEDKALYHRGIELYRSLKKGQAHADAWLEKVERATKTLKKRLFNAALREFDLARQAHLEGSMTLETYLDLLLKKAAEQGVATELLRNLRLVSEIRQKESTIDFDAPDDEDLQRYLDYAGLASKIKPEDLLLEIAWLEDRVYGSLTVTEDERTLLDASKKRETLGRLVHLKAMSEDIAAIEADPGAFDAAELGGFLNAKIMELERHYEDAVFLDAGYQKAFEDARQFYALTKERDLHFIASILAKMEEAKESEAAFVAGGFHTENLKRLLKEKNVSYVAIVPKVTRETDQRRYEKLLLDQSSPVTGSIALDSSKMWGVPPGAELVVPVDGARMAVKDMLREDLGSGAWKAASSLTSKTAGARMSEGKGETPEEKYLARLDLLNKIGVLRGAVLYPLSGNDFYPGYFARVIGLNSRTGMNSDKESFESVKSSHKDALPISYRERPVDFKSIQVDAFDVSRYLPALSVSGGIHTLFLKGFTYWSLLFRSNGESFKDAMQKIRALVHRLSDEAVMAGGFVVTADSRDTHLSTVLREKGYRDYLKDPRHEGIAGLLTAEDGQMDHVLSGIGHVTGGVPIQVYQKPDHKNHGARLAEKKIDVRFAEDGNLYEVPAQGEKTYYLLKPLRLMVGGKHYRLRKSENAKNALALDTLPDGPRYRIYAQMHQSLPSGIELNFQPFKDGVAPIVQIRNTNRHERIDIETMPDDPHHRRGARLSTSVMGEREAVLEELSQWLKQGNASLEWPRGRGLAPAQAQLSMLDLDLNGRVFVHPSQDFISKTPSMAHFNNTPWRRFLRLLDNLIFGDFALPLPGSLGQIVLRSFDNDAGGRVLLIAEVQESRAYHRLRMSERKKLDAWKKLSIERITEWARSRAIDVYATSPETIQAIYDLSDIEIQRNYVRPFPDPLWRRENGILPADYHNGTAWHRTDYPLDWLAHRQNRFQMRNGARFAETVPNIVPLTYEKFRQRKIRHAVIELSLMAIPWDMSIVDRTRNNLFRFMPQILGDGLSVIALNAGKVEGALIAVQRHPVSDPMLRKKGWKSLSPYIGMLAVDPMARRMGIATELIREYAGQVPNATNSYYTYLDVQPGNTPAMNFYKRIGFEPVSTPYPDTGHVFQTLQAYLPDVMKRSDSLRTGARLGEVRSFNYLSLTNALLKGERVIDAADPAARFRSREWGDIDLTQLNDISHFNRHDGVYFLARAIEFAAERGLIDWTQKGGREVSPKRLSGYLLRSGDTRVDKMLAQQMSWRSFFKAKRLLERRPSAYQGDLGQLRLVLDAGISGLRGLYAAFGGPDNPHGWMTLSFGAEHLSDLLKKMKAHPQRFDGATAATLARTFDLTIQQADSLVRIRKQEKAGARLGARSERLGIGTLLFNSTARKQVFDVLEFKFSREGLRLRLIAAYLLFLDFMKGLSRIHVNEKGEIDGVLITVQGANPAAFHMKVKDHDHVIVAMLGVRPEAKRQGIATKLIRESLIQSSRWNAKTIYLNVLTDNAPAIALYKKLGFEQASPAFVVRGKSFYTYRALIADVLRNSPAEPISGARLAVLIIGGGHSSAEHANEAIAELERSSESRSVVVWLEQAAPTHLATIEGIQNIFTQAYIKGIQTSVAIPRLDALSEILRMPMKSSVLEFLKINFTGTHSQMLPMERFIYQPDADPFHRALKDGIERLRKDSWSIELRSEKPSFEAMLYRLQAHTFSTKALELMKKGDREGMAAALATAYSFFNKVVMIRDRALAAQISAYRRRNPQSSHAVIRGVVHVGPLARELEANRLTSKTIEKDLDLFNLGIMHYLNAGSPAPDSPAGRRFILEGLLGLALNAYVHSGDNVYVIDRAIRSLPDASLQSWFDDFLVQEDGTSTVPAEINDVWPSISGARLAEMPARLLPASGDLETLKVLGFEVDPNDAGGIRRIPGFPERTLDFNLVVVPHGQTTANAMRSFGGMDGETTHLTAKGHQDAAGGARRFWELYGDRLAQDPSSFVFVHTSRVRTYETASHYMDFLRSAEVETTMVQDAGANEINYGEWDETVTKHLTAEEWVIAEAYWNGHVFARAPNGENRVQLLRRADEWLTQANELYRGKTVVLFGHGTFTNALQILLKYKDYSPGDVFNRRHPDIIVRGYPLTLYIPEKVADSVEFGTGPQAPSIAASGAGTSSRPLNYENSKNLSKAIRDEFAAQQVPVSYDVFENIVTELIGNAQYGGFESVVVRYLPTKSLLRISMRQRRITDLAWERLQRTAARFAEDGPGYLLDTELRRREGTRTPGGGGIGLSQLGTLMLRYPLQVRYQKMEQGRVQTDLFVLLDAASSSGARLAQRVPDERQTTLFKDIDDMFHTLLPDYLRRVDGLGRAIAKDPALSGTAVGLMRLLQAHLRVLAWFLEEYAKFRTSEDRRRIAGIALTRGRVAFDNVHSVLKRLAALPMNVEPLRLPTLAVAQAFSQAISQWQTLRPDLQPSASSEWQTRLKPRFASVADLKKRESETEGYSQITVLTRHPQAYTNVLERLAAANTFSPWTRLGKDQADAFVGLVSGHFLQGKLRTTQIFTSASERAYGLAERAASAAGVEPTILHGLEEVQMYPDFTAGADMDWAALKFHGTRSSIEQDPFGFKDRSYSGERIERNVRILRGTVESSKRNTMIFTHGQKMLYLLMVLLDVPSKGYQAMKKGLKDFPPYVEMPSHAGVTVLGYRPELGQWEMLVWNDVSYMDPSLYGRKAEDFTGTFQRAGNTARLFLLTATRMLLHRMGRYKRQGEGYLNDDIPGRLFRVSKKKMEKMIDAQVKETRGTGARLAGVQAEEGIPQGPEIPHDIIRSRNERAARLFSENLLLSRRSLGSWVQWKEQRLSQGASVEQLIEARASLTAALRSLNRARRLHEQVTHFRMRRNTAHRLQALQRSIYAEYAYILRRRAILHRKTDRARSLSLAKRASTLESYFGIKERAIFLPVVDDEGRLTGRVIRKEERFTLAPGERVHSALVGLARLKDGKTQFLLQKRSEGMSIQPGRWDITAAGRREMTSRRSKIEDIEATAVRELWEESDFSIWLDREKLIHLSDRNLTTYRDAKTFVHARLSSFLHWISAQEETALEGLLEGWLPSEEVSEWRWVDEDEIRAGIAADRSRSYSERRYTMTLHRFIESYDDANEFASITGARLAEGAAQATEWQAAMLTESLQKEGLPAGSIDTILLQNVFQIVRSQNGSRPSKAATDALSIIFGDSTGAPNAAQRFHRIAASLNPQRKYRHLVHKHLGNTAAAAHLVKVMEEMRMTVTESSQPLKPQFVYEEDRYPKRILEIRMTVPRITEAREKEFVESLAKVAVYADVTSYILGANKKRRTYDRDTIAYLQDSHLIDNLSRWLLLARAQEYRLGDDLVRRSRIEAVGRMGDLFLSQPDGSKLGDTIYEHLDVDSALGQELLVYFKILLKTPPRSDRYPNFIQEYYETLLKIIETSKRADPDMLLASMDAETLDFFRYVSESVLKRIEMSEDLPEDALLKDRDFGLEETMEFGLREPVDPSAGLAFEANHHLMITAVMRRLRRRDLPGRNDVRRSLAFERAMSAYSDSLKVVGEDVSRVVEFMDGEYSSEEIRRFLQWRFDIEKVKLDPGITDGVPYGFLYRGPGEIEVMFKDGSKRFSNVEDLVYIPDPDGSADDLVYVRIGQMKGIVTQDGKLHMLENKRTLREGHTEWTLRDAARRKDVLVLTWDRDGMQPDQTAATGARLADEDRGDIIDTIKALPRAVLNNFLDHPVWWTVGIMAVLYVFYVHILPSLLLELLDHLEKRFASMDGLERLAGGLPMFQDPEMRRKMWETRHKRSQATQQYWTSDDAHIRLLRNEVQRTHEPRVILDVGSGGISLWNSLSPRNSDGAQRVVISLDVAQPRDLEIVSDGNSTSLLVKGNADSLGEILDAPMVQGFLQANGVSMENGPFDLIVLMDILNYVDHHALLALAASRLSPGGRIVISNMAGAGHAELFSIAGVKSNRALRHHLSEQGFLVTMVKRARYDFSPDEYSPFRDLMVVEKPRKENGARLSADVFDKFRVAAQDALKNVPGVIKKIRSGGRAEAHELTWLAVMQDLLQKMPFEAVWWALPAASRTDLRILQDEVKRANQIKWNAAHDMLLASGFDYILTFLNNVLERPMVDQSFWTSVQEGNKGPYKMFFKRAHLIAAMSDHLMTDLERSSAVSPSVADDIRSLHARLVSANKTLSRTRMRHPMPQLIKKRLVAVPDLAATLDAHPGDPAQLLEALRQVREAYPIKVSRWRARTTDAAGQVLDTTLDPHEGPRILKALQPGQELLVRGTLDNVTGIFKFVNKPWLHSKDHAGYFAEIKIVLDAQGSPVLRGVEFLADKEGRPVPASRSFIDGSSSEFDAEGAFVAFHAHTFTIRNTPGHTLVLKKRLTRSAGTLHFIRQGYWAKSQAHAGHVVQAVFAFDAKGELHLSGQPLRLLFDENGEPSSGSISAFRSARQGTGARLSSHRTSVGSIVAAISHHRSVRLDDAFVDPKAISEIRLLGYARRGFTGIDGEIVAVDSTEELARYLHGVPDSVAAVVSVDDNAILGRRESLRVRKGDVIHFEQPSRSGSTDFLAVIEEIDELTDTVRLSLQGSASHLRKSIRGIHFDVKGKNGIVIGKWETLSVRRNMSLRFFDIVDGKWAMLSVRTPLDMELRMDPSGPGARLAKTDMNELAHMLSRGKTAWPKKWGKYPAQAPQWRPVLWHWYWKGMSMAEMSQTLSLSHEELRARHDQGLEDLRKATRSKSVGQVREVLINMMTWRMMRRLNDGPPASSSSDSVQSASQSKDSLRRIKKYSDALRTGLSKVLAQPDTETVLQEKNYAMARDLSARELLRPSDRARAERLIDLYYNGGKEPERYPDGDGRSYSDEKGSRLAKEDDDPFRRSGVEHLIKNPAPEPSRLNALLVAFFLGIAPFLPATAHAADVPVKLDARPAVVYRVSEEARRVSALPRDNVDAPRFENIDRSRGAELERQAQMAQEEASTGRMDPAGAKTEVDSMNSRVRMALEMGGIDRSIAVVVEFDDSMFEETSQTVLFDAERKAYASQDPNVLIMRKGEPVPAAFSQAPRVHVFAPGSGFARPGAIHMPAEAFGKNVHALPALFDLASASGRITPETASDEYLSAYGMMAQRTIGRDQLVGIRAGRLMIAVRSVLSDFADHASAIETRLRMLSQSA